MADDFDDMTHLDRVMQLLQSAFDMKEKGVFTDAEFAELKRRLLMSFESVGNSGRAPQPLEGASNLLPLEMYAADLHRMMVQQMYREHPGSQGDLRSYMMNMMSMLAQHQALEPNDMPHMRMIVDTVCNDSFGQAMGPLMQGAAKLQSVNDQVRLSIETSRLAKTLAGIAHNSAQNAVFGIVPTEPIQPTVSTATPANVGTTGPSPASAATPTSTEPDTGRRWQIVKDDVGGALSGAGLAIGISAAPEAAAAAAAVTGALGPAVAVFGVLGALVAGGMASGLEWVRTKSGS